MNARQSPDAPKPTAAQLLFSDTLHKALGAIELASAYVEDGAYFNGAKHLRRAADLFEEAAKLRHAALTGETPK